MRNAYVPVSLRDLKPGMRLQSGETVVEKVAGTAEGSGEERLYIVTLQKGLFRDRLNTREVRCWDGYTWPVLAEDAPSA